MTRILQGWTITNGLAVLWKDGRVDQVLLDEPQRCFADVTDVAFTPDGKHGGRHQRGHEPRRASSTWRSSSALGAAYPGRGARRTSCRTGSGPRAEFVVAPGRDEGQPARRRGGAGREDGLGGQHARRLALRDRPRAPGGRRRGSTSADRRRSTHIRWGEKLFHNANITFQRQFACATCHPDGHVDGLTYDIEADGIGVSPVDNRTLRGIYDTDPFKWEGTNVEPRAAVRRAPRRLLHPHRALHARASSRAVERLHRDDPPAAEPPPAARRGAHARRSAGASSSSSARGRTTGARSRPRAAASSATSRRTSPTGSSATWARSRPSTGRASSTRPTSTTSTTPRRTSTTAWRDTLEEIWTRLQPVRQARRHERHDQGPAQRPDRVPEDAVTRKR